MKKHYINAVTELLLQGKEVDGVLKNLLFVLKAKGHEKLHISILKGVLLELAHKRAVGASQVVVASNESYAKLETSIEAALRTLGGSITDAQVSYDPTLIGGFIASHEGKLINRSYKEKLVSLYRSITK